MPFLRFKGFDKQLVQKISPAVVKNFARIAEIPEEIVKIELLQIDSIQNSPPSLEIMMFEREKEKHDAIARSLYQCLSEAGYENTHIFFILLTPSLYYKNGQPLKEIPKMKQPIPHT
ncbi:MULTISPECIES: DUF1904 family protein [Thermoactinomyces]|jgi:hypothetical protein|uniref:DUF1904 family protein n=1 Tax=Thermoactinomyces daqus TaxID=1329516 RepID=A0A7W1XD90_9BACL|nr:MULTISPECIES: DUF1904 family protein [Thermoactinomyces]MBA4544418.1 DUF1904 family protein [Thermoactinomyces daqus]MBH8598193.1 DUF1904 family protein [Thermoactinomyces sp. CICC 10523]MBH8603222.1 DUF1904 family protein [Thermoactinomyces sp. CICC 10522]MBH8608622.1 DUF1904 family protein [Thermoactinomyces sp. CICC 10521]